ncbi:MAG TPA: isocitrate/isopropylmalate dehydrogenase family protein [Firmicutes bacterium]|nr:isocitrate/isopropylmalate dehydrogenase family protein [Bacillota bacterium]
MHRVTLIPGDGIGPEVAEAARRVVEATGVKIEWEEAVAGEAAMAGHGTPLPDETVEAIRRNKVALKAPITTPIGEGFRSVNVGLRKALDLYCNLRPVKSRPGLPVPYHGVDIVIFRENTEDLYAGIERMVDDDTAESIKRITRRATHRIARAAYEFARREGRKKVTIGHKANIMKLADGLFLNACREVAEEYPDIETEDAIVDALSMRLVMRPSQYDVLLLPNLYGDILSDLCAGLTGGLGLAPGANLGDEAAVFEAVHGSAPKYAGLNKANPTALILSAALMLRHLGETEAAGRIERAVDTCLARGQTTYDLGGPLGTSEMADALIAAL